MTTVAAVLVGLVAALHAYFLVLETFLWKTAFGRKVFGTTAAQAEETATLAANQGIYNGFLAAALVWALAAYGVHGGRPVLTFTLGCVVVAGVVGAATANKKILFVQALPAAAALVTLWIA